MTSAVRGNGPRPDGRGGRPAPAGAGPLAAVAAHEARTAGSDAERRGARAAADALAAVGLRVDVRTHWFHPRADLVLGILGVLSGISAGVAVEAPVPGAVLAVLAGVLAVLEVGPRSVARRALGARATQDVVADDGREGRVRVVLVAAADVPRAGLLDRGTPARRVAGLRGRLRGRLPSRAAVVVLGAVLVGALCAVAAFGPLRDALGPLALLPALAALLAGAALVDRALAPPPRDGANADASSVAVVVGACAALAARPPANLAVRAWVTGARHDGEAGARHLLRELRGHGPATDTVVVEVGPSAAGAPTWSDRAGLLRPRRTHRQLEGCVQAAAQRTRQGARAVPSRRAGVAALARRRGHPSVLVRALDVDGLAPGAGTDRDALDAVDPAAVRATTTFLLAALVELDRELDGSRAADAGPG